AMTQLSEYIASAPDDPLSHGYLKMTLLDPHPANNEYGLNANFTVAGFSTVSPYVNFQETVADPRVVVPPGVNLVEDFYQQTDADQGQSYSTEATLLNLQGLPTGQLQIKDARTIVKALSLTGYGMGHSEVHDWYQKFVVPNLASGKTFIFSRPLQAT